MQKQRLTKRQINKLYKEYSEYFNGDETQIAYEFAKDFIYNASREYQRFLNQTFSWQNKKFKFRCVKTCENWFNLWKQAIEETAEYLKPTKTIQDSFENWIAKEEFKSK